MKIFITGGTGFIGKYTVNLLTKTSHQLKLLIRKSSNISSIKNQNVTLIDGDLTDKNSLLTGMQGCDAVINLAAQYSFWEKDKNVFHEVNVKGTRNVMESALQTGIKKVVHVSTAGIFGKPAAEPFNEDTPVGPERFSDYFKTKYEGDLIAWEMYEKEGLPLVVIYPACVLGAGDPKASGNYIQNLIDRKLPATVFKDDIFSFVCVKDVAQAIVKALEKENNIGEKYLVSGSTYTWKEINKLISKVSGVPLPKLELPSAVTMMNAYLLTGLANLIKKPPLWGMAVDQMKVMKVGINIDGSKAERELGIKYAPIRDALEEEINSFRIKDNVQKEVFAD